MKNKNIRNNEKNISVIIQNFPYLIKKACPKLIIERSSYIEVGRNLKYKFSSSSSSQKEVVDYIYESIRNTIEGGDIKRKDFYKIKKHFTLHFLLKKTELNKLCCSIAHIIFDSSRTLEKYTSKIECYEKAILFAVEYLKIGNFDPIESVEHGYQEEKDIVNAIEYFRKQGIKIYINNGEVLLSEKVSEQIIRNIEKNVQKMGLYFCHLILQKIQKFFNKRMEVYNFPKVKDSKLVPWGYLFNLSLKHISNKEILENKEVLASETIEMAENYCVLLEVRSYSFWSLINQTADSIFETLRENVIVDQVYTIQQIPAKNFKIFMNSFFRDIDESSLKLNWKISDFIDFYNKLILLREKSERYKINIEKLKTELIGLDGDAVEMILSDITEDFYTVNKEYSDPIKDIEKINFFKKPLIKTKDNECYFVSPHFFNFGFYEVLTNKLRESGFEDGKYGEILEEFIKERLDSHGLRFSSNEKYKISKKQQKEMLINKKGGECDFIIECDDTIIFIEVKKKILTAKAKCGYDFNIINDFIDSNFLALKQANWHEIILRKYGKIDFKSGNSIELKERKIEKVALTMFDYQSLHDKIFIDEIKKIFIGAKLTVMSNDSETIKKTEKTNKTLKELASQFKSKEFEIYWNDNHLNFFNCHFLNLFNLLEILEDVNNNEDFRKNIKLNSHVTYGTRDWYKEYNEAKKWRSGG